MELEGSLPCPQESATGPYHEFDDFKPQPLWYVSHMFITQLREATQIATHT